MPHWQTVSRRTFLASTGVAIATASLQPWPLRAADSSPKKRSLKKAIMYETIRLKGSVHEKFQAVKAAGFEGIEPMGGMNQSEVLKARDDAGLQCASVCCHTHWQKPITDPDPAVREIGLNGLRQSLRDAKAYGASSVLFVPAVVNKNVSYADAYTRSQTEIRKVLPLAEELGVKIAIENVGNHFLLSPLEAARYIDEFNSPAIGWHFDIGNVMAIGWPDHWIHVLGKRIQKLHIKEYARGKRANFLEGDNDWPTIMKALDDIGYNGWGIAEQPGADSPEGLKDLSDRMTKIFAS